MSFLMVMAPVVHTAEHCPQLTQCVSLKGLLSVVAMCRLGPRPAKCRLLTPCTSWQTRTQSPQRMHLLRSIVTAGLEKSILTCSRVSSKRTRWMPKRTAISCKRQARFFSQVVQSRQCAESSSSMIMRRYLSSRAVLVRMCSSFFGGMVQAASIFPVPSSSTMHIRHAP